MTTDQDETLRLPYTLARLQLTDRQFEPPMSRDSQLESNFAKLLPHRPGLTTGCRAVFAASWIAAPRPDVDGSGYEVSAVQTAVTLPEWIDPHVDSSPCKIVLTLWHLWIQCKVRV
jgi:hypothetical protein